MDLREIKELRKKLHLTQSELAKMSHVSQSLIAKIEAGRLDPTYSNAMKIFGTLDAMRNKKDKKAEEMMTTKIVSVLPSTPIRDAITKMKKFGLSQLVVIHDHKAVGMVSETSILEALIDNRGKKVEDIMESPPPVMPHDTSLLVIANLLKYLQLVIISKRGRIVGVITKSDLLANMYR